MDVSWDQFLPYADWVQHQSDGIFEHVVGVTIWPHLKAPVWQGVISSYISLPGAFLPSHPRVPRVLSGVVWELPALGTSANVYIESTDDQDVHISIGLPGAPLDPIDPRADPMGDAGLWISWGEYPDSDWGQMRLKMSDMIRLPSIPAGRRNWLGP
jgi:hypothetical protein